MPPVEDILAGGFVPVFPGPAAGVGLCGGAVDASGLGSSLPVCCGIVRFPESAVDTGNFWVMAWENLTTGQWASLAWGIEAGRLMQAPGLFLLGFVLGRQDFFLQNDGTAVFWTRGLLFSLAGTCAFYVVMCLPGLPGPVHTVFNMWHNVCFTGVWVAGFVLLYRLEYFRKATAPLLTYGRMSLTNYVSQSVIGSLIFSRMPWGWLPTAGIWSVLRSALPP